MKEFDIAFPLRHEPSEMELRQAAGRALGVKPERVAAVRIVRRSLDARGEILYRGENVGKVVLTVISWRDEDGNYWQIPESERVRFTWTRTYNNPNQGVG